MFLDLPKEIGSDELRREAAIVWGLATEAEFSRENLKFHLTLMQTNRWEQPLDGEACDKVAGAILVFAKRQSGLATLDPLHVPERQDTDNGDHGAGK
jgi:hypothetical protein